MSFLLNNYACIFVGGSLGYNSLGNGINLFSVISYSNRAMVGRRKVEAYKCLCTEEDNARLDLVYLYVIYVVCI